MRTGIGIAGNRIDACVKQQQKGKEERRAEGQANNDVHTTQLRLGKYSLIWKLFILSSNLNK